jgi:hypothetical protein
MGPKTGLRKDPASLGPFLVAATIAGGGKTGSLS